MGMQAGTCQELVENDPERTAGFEPAVNRIWRAGPGERMGRVGLACGDVIFGAWKGNGKSR